MHPNSVCPLGTTKAVAVLLLGGVVGGSVRGGVVIGGVVGRSVRGGVVIGAPWGCCLVGQSWRFCWWRCCCCYNYQFHNCVPN